MALLLSWTSPSRKLDTHFNQNVSSSHPFTSRISFNPRSRRTFNQSVSSSTSESKTTEESISIDVLKRFIKLNVGKWTGAFYQFDANGNLLNTIPIKLSASSYGEDELISLIQTLYIRQPLSNTSISDSDDQPEWAEYKIKETNMFTVDKYQQIGFFANERAFALRYQTAGMLDNILRQGVLGDDDTGEESPKNLKLPSRRPSIVCENCLYLPGKDLRARAFHIMDPKGVIEMVLIFLEERGDTVPVAPSLDINKDDNRIENFLGKWKGHSVTKRSGVYGATIAEADTISSLEYDDNGNLFQEISTTSESDKGTVTTNVHWSGTLSNNVITFDKGYQVTLLPGGMYIGCPCNIANSVADAKSFHLEFCWLESSTRRQRLVRTFDIEGLAVSSTYFSETKW